MSSTDRVKKISKAAGSKVAKGASKGKKTLDDVVLRPDKQYSVTIDLHRRFAYVISGMPFYAVAEQFAGMSDFESLKARGIDFAGSMLIAGWLLRGREATQRGFSPEIGSGYAGAGRIMVDLGYFATTSLALSVAFYIGLDTFNNIGDTAINLIHGNTFKDSLTANYDLYRLGKNALFNCGVNIVASPLRGAAPDIVNLYHRRRPSGKLPQFMLNKQPATYNRVQAIAGAVTVLSTIAAYVAL